MVALEAAAAEVVPSSQIGCRGGAKAEQHHQRGAAGVASRRGWSGSTEPSLGGRARGAAAERSPRLASRRSRADRDDVPGPKRWGRVSPGKTRGSGRRAPRRGLPNIREI